MIFSLLERLKATYASLEAILLRFYASASSVIVMIITLTSPLEAKKASGNQEPYAHLLLCSICDSGRLTNNNNGDK